MHLFPVQPRMRWFTVLHLLLSLSLEARINVTTLPGRDSVQLTIYNLSLIHI